MLIRKKHSRSVVQTAWSRIFDSSGTCSAEERQELRDLFPETQSMEKFDFSDLHKAVLGIMPTNPATLLAKLSQKSQINHRDAWDRTPLHWAAKASDFEAVASLINAGANVNVSDCMGTTPAHLAARARHPRGLELLLIAKANARARNRRGEEPIHYATHQSIAHVKALMTAGVSLCPLYDGILHWAVTAKKADVARFLIEQGLDRECVNEDGNTPLFHAVFFCAHECLDMLLASGVNTRHINKCGSTVLHWAARSGDVRVLEILSRWKVNYGDVGVRDGKGRSTVQVLQDRIHQPLGIQTAMAGLLMSMEDAAEEDSDDQFFFDAED